jgi:hypothetical protein
MIQRSIVNQYRNKGFEFIFAYPNNNSLAILKRVGYKIVGGTSMWVKPLRFGYKFFSYFKNKVLAKIFSFIPDLILNYFDYILLNPNYYGEVSNNIDERFDDLLNRIKYTFSIVPDRSSIYMNWRYLSCQTKKYYIYSFINKITNKLDGYVVYHIKNNKIFIVDIVCVDFDKIIYNLLAQFSIHMRSKKYDSICVSYVGRESFFTVLSKLNFLRRDLTRNFVIFVDKSIQSDIYDAIIDKNNWFMFNGELDV